MFKINKKEGRLAIDRDHLQEGFEDYNRSRQPSTHSKYEDAELTASEANRGSVGQEWNRGRGFWN